MLFDGILETTSSTTGSLTTSAVTGRPRFTDFFNANAAEALADLFYYSITSQDSPPKLYQQGIGYMSAAGTLVRVACIQDFSAGSFSHWPGAVPDLPAGTKNILCTGEAGSTWPGIYDMPFSSGSNRRAIAPYHYGQIGGGATLTKDRLFYVPIMLATPRRISGVRFQLGATAGVGGTNGARIGVYSALRSGAPGRKLAESGNLAATAYAELTYTFGTPMRLAPGLYFAAIATDYATTAPNIYASSGNPVSNGSPLGVQVASGYSDIQSCYEALTAGWSSLPSQAAAVASLTPVLNQSPIGVLTLE